MCAYTLTALYNFQNSHLIRTTVQVASVTVILKPGFNNLEGGFAEHFTKPEK